MAYQEPSSDEWRRFGKERRRLLLEEDKETGRMSFQINPNCSLDRYLELSNRVVSQFNSLCQNLNENLEDAYVMGHRLQVFLESALPQHPEYVSRRHRRRDMDSIREKLQEIALKIDEDQLNIFMDCNFDPVCLDDDDDDDNEESVEKLPSWEAFGDWPDAVETDTSSCEYPHESDEEPSHQEQPLYLFDIEPTDDVLYTLNEPVAATNFLRKIATEDFRYETDSEAVDSWAQDGASSATASSGTQLTCDPARIAFRSIMKSLPTMESLHEPGKETADVSSDDDLSKALEELYLDFAEEGEL